MIDSALRPRKDAALAPIVRRVPRWLGPGWLTALGLSSTLGAAALAVAGTRAAVVLWLIGRLLDGIDGALARERGTASDLGGFLDIVADTIGYAAVPIGLAAADGSSAAWAACAVLLAAFYVNAVSWTYLAAVHEKRRADPHASDRDAPSAGRDASAVAGRAAAGTTSASEPSITIPGGLIEGGETIVLYTAMLVWPTAAPALFVVMATLVAVTVAQRVLWARREL
jgi:phosphatidylglycerophosphate synthase